jgi:DNA-binding HxlR family transcriptional regulator
VTRFEDFHRDLGIARTVLSARLDRLVEHGVFVRRPYSEHPPRSEYLLTDKGRDLFPVLVTLMQWGDRWAADDGPPVRLVHEQCEHVTSPRLVCEHCGGDVTSDTARPEPA